MRIAKITLLLSVVVVLAVQSQASLIDLTKEGLGIDAGNYGPSLTINDVLNITAVTDIEDGHLDTGTVYLDKNKGLGVQNQYGQGSKGISGTGNSNEALVLNFTTAVETNSLSIGLNDYKYNSDDPIITATFSDGYEVVFDESHQNWDSAITYIGSKNISVNIGTLLGESYNGFIASLVVKESKGHIYLNCVE
ncbi:MAG: hypothetical protein JW912_05910, partial [Sedimentisphaerales bacterium]|nr:hypothetical protein [Sedimentisphaerales bacterium]